MRSSEATGLLGSGVWPIAGERFKFAKGGSEAPGGLDRPTLAKGTTCAWAGKLATARTAIDWVSRGQPKPRSGHGWLNVQSGYRKGGKVTDEGSHHGPSGTGGKASH